MTVRGAVAGLVGIGLVAVGAVVADGWARGNAEQTALEVIDAQLDVDGRPQVRIDGFPFLTQLAARSLDEVHATATGVTLDGVAVTDVVVDATDVTLDAPYQAGGVRVQATVPAASVQQVVAERAAMDVTVDGGVLRATGDVFGIPLTAGLVPRVADGRLLVDVEEVTLGAGTLQLEELPGDVAERLVGIEVPLAGLPEGVVLEDAVVEPTGVRFTATGTDVALVGLP